MNLKQALWVITSATKMAIIFFFAGVILYGMGPTDMTYMVLGLICVAIACGLTLSKRIILKRLMNKMSYPGLLYGVCDKMGFLRNLGIYPGEQIMNDLYRPSYRTEDFLSENKLSSDIYKADSSTLAISKFLNFFPIIAFAIIFFIEGKDMQSYTWLLICSMFLLPVLLDSMLKRKVDASGSIIYSFKKEGLQTPANLLAWENVYDWEFITGRQNEQPHIKLALIEPVEGSKEVILNLNDLAVVPTDFFLLLLHYKNKYGYVPEQE